MIGGCILTPDISLAMSKAFSQNIFLIPLQELTKQMIVEKKAQSLRMSASVLKNQLEKAEEVSIEKVKDPETGNDDGEHTACMCMP